VQTQKEHIYMSLSQLSNHDMVHDRTNLKVSYKS